MTFIGVATSFLMLSYGLSGQGTSSLQTTTIPMAPVADRSTEATTRFVDQNKREAMAKYLKEYFSDTPILADIAFCESTYRQLGMNGEVLRGNKDSDYIGVMQINLRYHGKQAEELGLDLQGLEGNLAYAKYLYQKQGVEPWRSSEKCWNQRNASKS